MENIEFYEVIKILHIVAIISWMAGLLYLPRIYVYHSQVPYESESDKLLQVMEIKLLRYIMLPAMVMTFIFGLTLANEIGFEFVWLHIKVTLALCLAGYHGFLMNCHKKFTKGQNKYTHKFYRIINEVPTILMIAIVTIVILKPFSA